MSGSSRVMMQRILILIRISPTAYDVFQGYTLTSEFLSDGSCRTVTNAPSTLPSPFVQTAVQSDGAVFFNAEGEQRFLDFLSLNNCTPRGEVVAPKVVAQVQNITVETTRFRTGGALAPPSRTLGQVSRCLFVGRGTISSSPVEWKSGHQNLLSMRKSASISLCLSLLHCRLESRGVHARGTPAVARDLDSKLIPLPLEPDNIT